MRHHPNILWIIGESLLIGVSAFVAGYLWPHPSPAPVITESVWTPPVAQSQSAEPAGASAQESHAAQQNFVASTGGTKYHPVSGCSYADRIKPENKIFFATQQEAQAAGYQPSTCLTK